METRNHWELSKYIIKDMDAPSALHRFLFCLGSVYPDINILTYLKGHTYNAKHRKIKSQIHKLNKKSRLGLQSMFRLGVIAHYMADSFTHPHTPNYSGSVWQHFQYEKRMRPLFRQYLSAQTMPQIQLSALETLEEDLDTLHLTYLSEGISPEQDCKYIFSAVVQLVQLLSAKVPDSEEEQRELLSVSVRKSASKAYR